MNAAFYRGFVKEAAAMQIQGGHVAVAVGAALAGLAVYDFFKGRSLPTVTKKDLRGEGAERVDARVWLETLLKKKPLKRPPVVVTSYEQLEPALKGTSFSVFDKRYIRNLARYVFRTEGNAFAVPDKAKDILIIPPKIHKHVVEHELGHVRDFAEKPYKKPGIIPSIVASVWKPKYKELVLEREERAWKHTRARKLKKKAVGSYERAFHFGRIGPTAASSYLAIKGGLEALRKAQYAKPSTPLPRT